MSVVFRMNKALVEEEKQTCRAGDMGGSSGNCDCRTRMGSYKGVVKKAERGEGEVVEIYKLL